MSIVPAPPYHHIRSNSVVGQPYQTVKPKSAHGTVWGKNNQGQTPINFDMLLIQELLAQMIIGFEAKKIPESGSKTAFHNLQQAKSL